jgi:hypothetical protein
LLTQQPHTVFLLKTIYDKSKLQALMPQVNESLLYIYFFDAQPSRKQKKCAELIEQAALIKGGCSFPHRNLALPPPLEKKAIPHRSARRAEKV